MFCKNCGKELTEDSVACGDCGFKKGDGEGYCSHCGQPVAKGQYMCVKCGFLLSEETPSSNKNFRKKALSNPFVKATVFQIVAVAVSIVLILCMLFLPIFKVTYSAYDIRELEKWYHTWGQQVLDEDDYDSFFYTEQKDAQGNEIYVYEHKYSFFDEVCLTIRNISARSSSMMDWEFTEQSWTNPWVLLIGIMEMGVLIVALVILAKLALKLLRLEKLLRDKSRSDNENSLELLKNKHSLCISALVVTAVLAVFALLTKFASVTCVSWGAIFNQLLKSRYLLSNVIPSYTAYMGGVTVWIVLAVVLFVAVVLFDVLGKRIISSKKTTKAVEED